MPSASTTASPTPAHRRGSTSRRPSRGQVGDEDADDERGFEAFAQADEEGGEHGIPGGEEGRSRGSAARPSRSG